MSEEKLSFQAEVSRLLDIVTHSLYSNKEIFLRELISNASDACDKLRYAALTTPAIGAEVGEFRITLLPEPKSGCLTVEDNGIGMSREELIENLGTIARSGTAAFLEQMKQGEQGKAGEQAKTDRATSGDPSLIGQFGVGFYSAFMVAEEVTVESCKAGESQGWTWRSSGQGDFTVAECADAPRPGTRIRLKLRKDARDYLDAGRLRHIVKTYSDHIAVPIVLLDPKKEEGSDGAETTLNEASALWTRNKSDISAEQYREFYHHVAHAFDEPWLQLHFKAEGKIEYTGLLFVPSSRPFDLFQADRKHGVKLYVRRVFITGDCEGLVPAYLRFLRGIVDSQDLSLNVSRETLQHDPLLAKIRRAVTKRVLTELGKKADKAPEDYHAFWQNFGPVLKEGIYEDQDQRDKLLELARFRSTRGESDWVSLKDYLAAMKEGQTEIYYISGESVDHLRRSPQLEGFQAKGVEVLLMEDPVDDFWLSVVGDFEGKPFRSVTRGAVDLSVIKSDDDSSESPAAEPEQDSQVDGLVAYMKLTLGDAVKDVQASKRLTSSACCLVADAGDMDLHLERMLKQHKQLDHAAARILEINPRHALVQGLARSLADKAAGADDQALADAAFLLLDQARIQEGENPADPGAFTRRLSDLVLRGFEKG